MSCQWHTPLKCHWETSLPAADHVPLTHTAISPCSAQTPFAGVEQLPPGSYLLQEIGKDEVVRRYWSPTYPARSLAERVGLISPSFGGEERATERVRAAMEESVRLRVLQSSEEPPRPLIHKTPHALGGARSNRTRGLTMFSQSNVPDHSSPFRHGPDQVFFGPTQTEEYLRC